MLAAVVFDMDGVLLNSEPLHLRAYQAVLGGRRVRLTAAEYADQYLGFDDPVIFRRLSDDRGLSWTAGDIDELVRNKIDFYRRELERQPQLFPGAAACVARFAAEVPLAIASGALHEEIELVLALTGLRRHFVALVGSDDTPRSKPAPDPYAEAVARLSAVVGHSLHLGYVVGIEDSLHGVESIRSAGLRAVAVTNTYASRDLTRADLIVETLDGLSLDALRTLCE